jgi:hypothetical protein
MAVITLTAGSNSGVTTRSICAGLASRDFRITTPRHLCVQNPLNNVNYGPVLSIKKRLGGDGWHERLGDYFRCDKQQEVLGLYDSHNFDNGREL